MIDIQSQKDSRNIDIKKVGVKNIKYPVIVLDRAKGTQLVNATINMYVNLPHHFKGTHMSRFVEALNEFKGQINIKTFRTILEKMRQKLHAHSAHMEIEFAYFLEKTAPVSKAKSLMEYRCIFAGESNAETSDFLVGVVVPVTTLCPCSKEISAFGAHNQRSIVTVKVRFRKFFWIEDFHGFLEWHKTHNASCNLRKFLSKRCKTVECLNGECFLPEDKSEDYRNLFSQEHLFRGRSKSR